MDRRKQAATSTKVGLKSTARIVQKRLGSFGDLEATTTLVYKMTHKGDSDPDLDHWGVEDCMGRVRGFTFDAVNRHRCGKRLDGIIITHGKSKAHAILGM